VSLQREVAILSLKDGVEQMDMRLSLDTINANLGLIVPTPTPATVSLGVETLFDNVDTEMTPKIDRMDDWWTWPTDGLLGASGGAPGAPAPPEVIATVQLGPIQATTLEATDAEGLTAWLTANGYGLPESVTALLPHYIDRGWSFVALKLTGETPLDGKLDPLRFQFETATLTYPLALSKAATTPQYVSLFIFSDHREEVRFADGSEIPDADTTWARTVRNTSLTSLGTYLTAITLTFGNPSQRILDDLTFVRAPADEEVGTHVTQVTYIRVAGVPVGWGLVGLAVFVMFLVIVFMLIPRRARR
jgi:hypothetical protein